MKIRIILLFLVCFNRFDAQNLTISSSGETGTSGTNWSVSGTNPARITSTNSSNINVSVIQGYINSGVDIVITSTGNIIVNSDITKNNSGRLILKSRTNSISGTGKFSLGNNAQLLIGHGVTITNNIELISGNATIGFAPIEIEYLIVAGGGAGGVGRGGGGGAGGVRTGTIEVASGTHSITVGAGGAAVTNDQRGNNGSNSSAFNITATGGGGGGGWVSGLETGANGGSGGGASGSPFQAGTGIVGQGNNGFWLNYYREPGGGGGGAGTAASSQDGGLGIVTNITGNSMWIGGGGGAGSMNGGITNAGFGGVGGGGNGTKILNGTASSGLVNTGGGGGGAEGFTGISGSGGSGIIVLRYFGSDIASGGVEYAGTNFALGYQVHEFKQIGTVNFSIDGSIVQGTISGQISGIGNLILNPSSGIINILGNNTYSGNTTITSGSIQIGNNGIDGNLGTGNIVNNGILTVNKSNSLSIPGIISGSGSIIKQGAGLLIFTQNNTYSGSTTISAGSIQLGDNSSSGMIGSGNIVNNGNLIFKRTDNFFFNNTISGTGTLTKENSNVLTLTQNNTYGGHNTINGGILVLQNNAPNPTNKTFNGIGKLRIEPTSNSFSSGINISGWSFGSSLTELSIGKSTNSSDITLASTMNINGPIEVYGGNININENLNTSAGNTNGDILIKALGDINQAASKSITTNGGDVILWSNCDGQSTNGGVFFDQSASIATGGGHIWIGGGSGTTTWNGLTVGNGFAVSGKNLIGLLTRTSYKVDWDAGILLNETSLNSGGGNIYMAGQRNARTNYSGGAGIINYNGTNGTSINAGTGLIEIKGDGSHTGDVTLGFMSGLHPGETAGSLTIQSANASASQAIVIQGSNATTNFPAFLVEDDTYILSTATSNGGGISLSGTLAGNHYGIWAQVGSLNVLSASGPISIDGGAKGIGLHVNTTFSNTSNQTISNTGHLYLGSRVGSPVTSSSATINVVSDRFTTNTGSSINIASSGALNVVSKSLAFSESINTSQWNLGTNLSSIIIGKTTNTENINFGRATAISGSVSIFGGNLNINENINTTSGGVNGDILLKASSDITFAKAKTISSSGGDMIFWADADGNGAGDIFFASENNYSNPVTISTGGGNLWMGGGSGTTTWNGLTVGNSFAVGNGARTVGGSFTHYNGITFQGTSINTSGGNIKLNGRGKIGDFSNTFSGGMYIVGSGTMNSGGGNIEIQAEAQSGTGQKYGFYNLGPYTFATGAGDLTIFGDASASNGGTINTTGNGVLLWAGDISTAGNISIKGKKSSTSGTFGVYININIVTAGNNKNITLETDNLYINSVKTITSIGQLIVKPFNPASTIGIGGASGTLSLPSSYFSTNFSDGFANIQIGSDSQTGNIAANTFTLRDNMTFLTSGSLTLGGKPVLGNNNITLGSSISSISANASNYFQTNGTGKVISTLANNAARLYPVGNAFYNGVTITNKTNATDTFSVLIKDSVLGNGDTGRQIATPHVKATWDISKNNTNGGNGVDFEFNWSASQEVGGINTFVLNHHNDTVWQIASGTAGSVSGTTTKSMSHSGYMGRFSPFAFGPGVTPLSVELIKFQATCQSDYIQIDWTTASEKRNNAFELYKSEDAQDWKLIHTIEGQGTKATETDYQFNDLDKKAGYYRLKDIDEDGVENWSQIIFAACKNETTEIQIYPNPASDYIKVIVPQFENTTLNILSLEGKIVKTMPLVSNQTLVSVKDLAIGIYLIEISNQKQIYQMKFLKK